MRDGVAHLRAAWAAHPDDQVLTALITDCVRGDPDVARAWAQRDVTQPGRGEKVVHHPEHGVLTTRFEVLRPLSDPDQMVVIHQAADATSRRALDRMSGS